MTEPLRSQSQLWQPLLALVLVILRRAGRGGCGPTERQGGGDQEQGGACLAGEH